MSESKKYEVVISGMGGIFPGCEDINDFESKLFNKEEMIEQRKYWDSEVVNVPNIVGKCNNFHCLDCTFFGLHNNLFIASDPMCTQCLKNSFEAICDAGVNPFTLSGTKTAVIMGCETSETELHVLYGNQLSHIFRAILGQSKAMQANRISYFLNLRGPSYIIEDNWAGGLQALQMAYQLLSTGLCSAAIVGSANCIFRPEFSYHFHAMGKLNSDGKTKCFSAQADGYTRSEGSVVFFLQRAEDAKRSYGTIANVLTCNYGARTTSYPEFSPELYKELLLRVYEEAQIDPSEVCYIEADGSASKKMDALELNSISEVMCANRTTPLAVGSVKSNVGHSEVVSGLASIVKVLMAFKSGFIPPNLHYTSPNPDVPALLSGQMEVVSEPTPLNGNIVGVSSIGLSGSYGHVIIKQNSKIKSSSKQTSSSNMPWLFIISGRTEESLQKVIEKVETMPFNEQFIALAHHVFKSHLKGYYFRGYTLLNTRSKRKYEIKEKNAGEKKPIWFLFSGMGSQWPGMGADLMRLPVFARAINHCHEVLLSKGVNLLEIIYSTDPHIYDCILNSFIGITAIQIGLVDVLRELGIEPNGIIGHSVGEVGCAYADGCFTAEQAILGAYARGKASLEIPLIKGMMAAIGLGYNQIKDQLPPTIEVACHNSNTSCTLSGPAEDMEQFVASLKIKDIYAKLVNVCNIAYHSRYINDLGPSILNYLKQIIPEPKQRTKRWISSSVPESSWDSDLAKFCSAEYHTNNLLKPVLFEEASLHIPTNCIVIEIAPHGLLQPIVRKSLPTCSNIPLVNRFEKDDLVQLLTAIGKLYLLGVDVNVDNLYPNIEFPMFGPIPSLSPLLTWKPVTPPFIHNTLKSNTKCQHVSVTDLSDKRLETYYGHSLCGKQVISFTLLLHLAIEKFKKLNQATVNQDTIEIKNVWFNEEFEALDELCSEITLQVQSGSGLFEIELNSQILVMGQISFFESDNEFSSSTGRGLFEEPMVEMSHNEIYKFFEEYSIKFNENFKSIQKLYFNKTEINAVIQWKGDWIIFLDAVMMLVSLSETIIHNQFQRVHFIRQIYINFAYFNSFDFKEIMVSYNKLTQELSGGGFKLHLPLTGHCSIKPEIPKLTRESRQFLPYYNTSDSEQHYGQIDDCFRVIFQNILQYNDKKLKVILFDASDEIYDHLLNYYNQVDIINSPTEDILDQFNFNLNKTDNLLLIGAPAISKTALTCLTKVAVGFVLFEDKLKIENLDNLYLVFKFKFNNMKYSLHKMCYEENQAINTIKFGNNNNKWKTDLKLSLKREVKELEAKSLQTVYLLGEVSSIFKIHETVQYCLGLENANIIRFIFLDDNAPPFSLDQPFYKKQIAMDLVMNICVNRKWGCLKISTPTIKSSYIPLESHQHSIYSISSIKSESVRLHALGLNLMAFNENLNVEKLGVFDYCGLDEAGNTVCGVGMLSDGKELNEDKILRWLIPHNWTYEEAVSIPFCYTIAYYILREKDFSPVNKKTILVHRGGLLVSQAIIQVALSRGCEVFTTYTTVEEKHLILELFPQINHSNIYFCKSFERLLLNKTNDKGVNIVVMANDDKAILNSSLLVLSRRGVLYLLNRKVINDNSTIGMLHFLKELTVKGISSEMLLDQHPSTKWVIQKEVETGINEGHVKPLRTFTLPSDTLNIEAIDTLNSKDGYSSKVVAVMECSEKQCLKKELFICSGQKCQIILSNEDSFCLDLLNWLLCRGARNVHLFNEFHKMDGSTTLRFLSILNNYPSANINSHPKKCSSLRTLMENINCQQEISELFCLGKVPEEEINKLDIILKDININTRLICIGNGGEAVCELRNKNNIPGLAISCELHLVKGSILLPELDRIINYCGDDSVITLSKEVHYKTAEFNNLVVCQRRLPDDITELQSLQRKLVSKTCFIETMTKCASYKYNKEVDPIFVIPSLRPNEMDKLMSRLQYPTFEARLPHDVDDIDTIAKDLFEDMKRFKFNVFTIIANEWGGAVGLNLAKYLENSGKLVMLILLNSSPNSVHSWASAVLEMGDNLINKYLNLPFNIRHKLSLLSNWNEKLDFALQSSIDEEADREEIRKAINILRKYLLSSMKYTTGEELFRGKCIVYRTKDSTQDDSIKQCCRLAPVINTIDSRDHIEMLEDPQFVNTINSLIPFENKTAAHGLTCDSLGVIITKSVRSYVAEIFTKKQEEPLN